MKNNFANALGSTGLWPVQFGVPPNCGRNGDFLLQKNFLAQFVTRRSVSGATPETARGTRALPISKI
jgi:hypothetical protein